MKRIQSFTGSTSILLLLLILAMSGILFPFGNQALSDPFYYMEDFTGGFDPGLFTLIKMSEVNVDTSSDNFRVSVNACQPGTQQYCELLFNCALRGNFDVSVDYNAITFPGTSYAWGNSIVLFVREDQNNYHNCGVQRWKDFVGNNNNIMECVQNFV